MNIVIENYNQVVAWLNGMNPVMGGAVTLWILTVGSYLLRNVPRAIYQFLKRQLSTSVSLLNDDSGAFHYYSFYKWFSQNYDPRLSRTFTFADTMGKSSNKNAGPGDGFHAFFYKRRLYWMHQKRLESSGSNTEKREIQIFTLGRSPKPIIKMIQDMLPAEDDTKIRLWKYDVMSGWLHNNYDKITKRPTQSLAFDEREMNYWINLIQDFMDNDEWFYKAGLPYKLSVMLHGKPGTGKTSLIRYLASYFERDIAYLNMNMMTDETLQSAFESLPEKSFVLIEDFDSIRQTQTRFAHEKTKVKKSGNQPIESKKDSGFGFLTLSGILNALDGVKPMDDVVLFMTTNLIDEIDPALLRPGRIDVTREIKETSGRDVAKFANNLFETDEFSADDFPQYVLGADINGALLASRGDKQVFIDHFSKMETVK